MPGANRTVWSVMLGLLVFLVVLGVVSGKTSSTPSSTITQGMRAVVVPTADAARTVVVPPCGTGAPISSGATASFAGVTGVTIVQLPQGSGIRLVLVPRCAAGSGAATGTSLLPSAAFVPKPGTPIPATGTGTANSSSSTSSGSSSSSGPVVSDPSAATSQLVVSTGSDVRVVVVPPCKGTSTGPSEQILGSSKGSPGTAVARAC